MSLFQSSFTAPLIDGNPENSSVRICAHIVLQIQLLSPPYCALRTSMLLTSNYTVGRSTDEASYDTSKPDGRKDVLSMRILRTLAIGFGINVA